LDASQWEATVRLSVFLGVFAGMAALELVAEKRPRRATRWVRWRTNLALMVVNTALLRVLFPTAAVGMALFAEARGWGLLAQVGWPAWAEVAAAVVLLDLAIYVQHVIFHALPLLWRLHQVHHAEVDLDVTSGTRFHPIEMVLSMGIKLGVVAFLGAPAVAVVIFETVLNGMAMFNHSNVRLPGWLDGALRWVVVTPDVHRVHHSIVVAESNTNFGFNLSLWDRLFGTFRDAAERGEAGLVLGVSEHVDQTRQGLWWLLALPFTSAASAYAMGGEVGPDPRRDPSIEA
jgi:sterol desaturase/sphingolipid hydroxylase (fatty acid hydroxylase superfamily)